MQTSRSENSLTVTMTTRAADQKMPTSAANMLGAILHESTAGAAGPPSAEENKAIRQDLYEIRSKISELSQLGLQQGNWGEC